MYAYCYDTYTYEYLLPRSTCQVSTYHSRIICTGLRWVYDVSYVRVRQENEKVGKVAKVGKQKNKERKIYQPRTPGFASPRRPSRCLPNLSRARRRARKASRLARGSGGLPPFFPPARTWAGARVAGGTPLPRAQKLTRFFFFEGIRNDTIESYTTAYILRAESFS